MTRSIRIFLVGGAVTGTACEMPEVACIDGKRKIAGRLESPLRLFFQATPDNAVQPRRRLPARGRQFRHILFQDGVHDLHRGLAAECPLARNHLVENSAKTENVGAMIEGLPAHLLGGHVADRSHDCARSGRRGDRHGWRFVGGRFGRSLLGQTEIENLHAFITSDENVVGLQVAMHHCFFVRRRESLGDFKGVFGRFAARECSGR